MWMMCLVCGLVLVVGGIGPALEAFGQAMGVRELLQAEASLPEDALANPFVCLRDVGTGASMGGIRLDDRYLQAVSLCAAGEQEDGLKMLKLAGENSGADIQYAAVIMTTDTLAGASLLRESGLEGRELAVVAQKLVSQSGVDPLPLIRLVAENARDDSQTWTLWLQGSSQLEAKGDWQAALDWIDEGLAIAPKNVQSSLLLRKGRIYQTRVDPRDYISAVKYFQQAIINDEWIYPTDEGAAHLYLGEVYRTLKDEYNPRQALAEFIATLNILPGNYSALLDMGHLYFNDLKDLSQAETYYRQALESNSKSPYAYLYLGDVFRERGDTQAAKDWYQQALALQPKWQAALDRIKNLEGK